MAADRAVDQQATLSCTFYNYWYYFLDRVEEDTKLLTSIVNAVQSQCPSWWRREGERPGVVLSSVRHAQLYFRAATMRLARLGGDQGYGGDGSITTLLLYPTTIYLLLPYRFQICCQTTSSSRCEVST